MKTGSILKTLGVIWGALGMLAAIIPGGYFILSAIATINNYSNYSAYSSLLSGIGTSSLLIGILVIVFGCLLAYTIGSVLFGFGELVECTAKIDYRQFISGGEDTNKEQPKAENAESKAE